MNVILPFELLDYIFEFINLNNIIDRLNSLTNEKLDLYMFFIKNNMNSYYESAHASHRMKKIEKNKEMIFRIYSTRLLMFSNFIQTSNIYYVKGNKGLLLSNKDKVLFIDKLKLKN